MMPIAAVAKKNVEDQSINFATECAFNYLIYVARREGAPIQEINKLTYLPSQQLIKKFRETCREVIQSLNLPGEDHCTQ